MASTSLRKVAVIAAAVTALGGTVAISAPRTALVRTGLDGTLVRMLEERFTPATVQDWSSVTGLIVAGGSVVRAAEAIRLAERHPHLRIVLSGPGDAEIAQFAQAGNLGDRLHIDRQPQNTYENAVMSKALVAPGPGERWLLVTSASHMPRAIGAFYAVGFHVDAWPVNDGDTETASQVATHEWLGLVAYWLRGRTIALFPGESHVSGVTRAVESRAGLTRRS